MPTVVIKARNKYRAVSYLDSECIDYNISENSDGDIEITILDGDIESIVDKLEELDVG